MDKSSPNRAAYLLGVLEIMGHAIKYDANVRISANTSEIHVKQTKRHKS